MGADIKSLRNRIKSVDSTLHLTKAMGLVASSKIRRATENMQKSRQYMKALSDAVASLTSSPETKKSPYLKVNDNEKICLIVIAGDRGLAGGYNSNIFKLAKEFEGADIIPIGKRAVDRFGGDTIYAENFPYETALMLSKKLCEDFCENKYKKIGIVYTKYVSIMSQEPEIKWLLPLDANAEKSNASTLFEPDEETVLNAVIYEYVAGCIMSCVRESFTSEVVARRFAMDNAGKNATEMIDNLSLEYNRARQSAITQEITEIVAGSGL